MKHTIHNIAAKLTLAALLAGGSANCLQFQQSDFDNTTGLGNALLFLLIGQEAIFALGQQNTSTVRGVQMGMQRPRDVLVTGNRMIVADNRLKRILIYNSIPTTNGTAPDVVVGQPDVHTGGIQVVTLPTNARYLNDPSGIATDGTRLIAADRTANRVLIWNTIPTTNFQPADVVLGQSDFSTTNSGTSTTLMNNPTAAAVCGGRLYVSDTQNNRVMGWNSIPTVNGTPADFVFGQPNATSNTPGATSGLMSAPHGIACSGTQMFVADTSNNRVLNYATLPVATAANASQVVGQTGFGNSGSGGTNMELFGPEDVFLDQGNNRLYVADTQNNRLLFYTPIPAGSGAAASGLLGQDIFGNVAANNGGVSTGLGSPMGVFSDGANIYLADNLNNRIAVWKNPAPSNFAPVDFAVGQQQTTANGEYFAGASLSLQRQIVDVATNGTSLFSVSDINNRVLRWATVPTTGNVAANNVIGQSDGISILQNGAGIGASTVNMPLGVCATASRLYVADQQNNRVLIWTSLPVTNGAGADLVLGQSNFTANMSNAGGSTAQNTLNAPNYISCTDQRVIISDAGNNRMLIWNSPPNANMQNADVVVGQLDFTSNANGPASFDGPRVVMVAENKMIVSDSGQHRVLIWNTVPTTNGVSPDIVLGQTNFTNVGSNAGAGNTSANALGFFSPAGLASYNGSLLVADLFNSRVLIYRSIPTVSNTAPDLVFGQADFTSRIPNPIGVTETSVNVPFGITVHEKRLYIADAFNHRILAVPVSRLGLE